MTQKSLREKWNQKVRVAEAMTDLGVAYYLVDDNDDFIPFVKEYLDMVQARSMHEVSPNTLRTYCSLLWHFIVFLNIHGLGILDLDGRPDILVRFKLWLKNPYRLFENILPISDECSDYKEDRLSIKTQNLIILRVSSLFLWLKATHCIKENPIIYRDIAVTSAMRDRDLLAHTRRNRTMLVNTLKAKEPKTAPKIINEKGFKKFLSTVRMLRDKIILLVLKEGGLRASELRGIKLEDLDFAESGIWIRFRPDNKNKARAKAGYGKDRFVVFPPDLMSLIDHYIATDWLESNTKDDFLFVVINSPSKIDNGNPLSKEALESMFKYYSRKTNINLHAHMLRHTHATELAQLYIDKNEPINWKYIAERLGHSSVVTTMQTYSHLNISDYKKEYLRLAEHKKAQHEEAALIDSTIKG